MLRCSLKSLLVTGGLFHILPPVVSANLRFYRRYNPEYYRPSTRALLLTTTSRYITSGFPSQWIFGYSNGLICFLLRSLRAKGFLLYISHDSLTQRITTLGQESRRHPTPSPFSNRTLVRLFRVDGRPLSSPAYNGNQT